MFNFSPSIASAFLRSAALKQEAAAVKDENADLAELTIVSKVAAPFSSLSLSFFREFPSLIYYLISPFFPHFQQPISALSNLLKSGAAAAAAAVTGGGSVGGDVQAAAAAAAQAAAAAAGLPPPDQESIQRLAAVLSAAQQQQQQQQSNGTMKVPPMTLPTAGAAGLALPFSPDLLWRYPNPFMPQPPPSPMESHLKVGSTLHNSNYLSIRLIKKYNFL